jgi:hypothetical protein
LESLDGGDRFFVARRAIASRVIDWLLLAAVSPRNPVFSKKSVLQVDVTDELAVNEGRDRNKTTMATILNFYFWPSTFFLFFLSIELLVTK